MKITGKSEIHTVKKINIFSFQITFVNSNSPVQINFPESLSSSESQEQLLGCSSEAKNKQCIVIQCVDLDSTLDLVRRNALSSGTRHWTNEVLRCIKCLSPETTNIYVNMF